MNLIKIMEMEVVTTVIIGAKISIPKSIFVWKITFDPTLTTKDFNIFTTHMII